MNDNGPKKNVLIAACMAGKSYLNDPNGPYKKFFQAQKDKEKDNQSKIVKVYCDDTIEFEATKNNEN